MPSRALHAHQAGLDVRQVCWDHNYLNRPPQFDPGPPAPQPLTAAWSAAARAPCGALTPAEMGCAACSRSQVCSKSSYSASDVLLWLSP